MAGEPGEYVRGTAPPQQSRTAGFEFKAPAQGSGGRGGGYPRWRSYEHREHTPSTDKEDVYVPVHRLCAVAWLFPDEMTAVDILDSEVLVGCDVHHELGMPAANIDDELAILDHGRHSEVTQAEMRAYAADARRSVADEDSEGHTSDQSKNRVCADCGDESETLCISPDFEGSRCPACAKQAAGEHPIEVL